MLEIRKKRSREDIGVRFREVFLVHSHTVWDGGTKYLEDPRYFQRTMQERHCCV